MGGEHTGDSFGFGGYQHASSDSEDDEERESLGDLDGSGSD